jgi:hypothetical protein
MTMVASAQEAIHADLVAGGEATVHDHQRRPRRHRPDAEKLQSARGEASVRESSHVAPEAPHAAVAEHIVCEPEPERREHEREHDARAHRPRPLDEQPSERIRGLGRVPDELHRHTLQSSGQADSRRPQEPHKPDPRGDGPTAVVDDPGRVALDGREQGAYPHEREHDRPCRGEKQ